MYTLPFTQQYRLLTPLKYHVIENNMENGAFALLEAVLSVHSSSAVILPRKFTLCSCCHVDISILCLFLVVPWVDLLSVIVAYPSDTHLSCDEITENKLLQLMYS